MGECCHNFVMQTNTWSSVCTYCGESWNNIEIDRLTILTGELVTICEALIRRWECDHPKYDTDLMGTTFFDKILPYDSSRDCPEVRRARAVIKRVRGEDNATD